MYPYPFGQSDLLCAALANLKIIKDEKLVENSAQVGKVLDGQLQKIKDKFNYIIGFSPCQGLVGGLLIVKPGTKEPNYDLAWDIIHTCFRKGLLLFAPVGVGGGCVKIAPLLCITKEAVLEGCQVLRESIKQILDS